ncbi:MAG: flippase-like domain-containing protein, partial [Betaproteobacteria bacterium]|nr:flippase-like domain-containing protein [Betaproteobacteria bacterium]
LAVLLLCLPGLSLYPALHPVVMLMSLAGALMLLFLSREAWIRAAISRLSGRSGRAIMLLRHALGLLRQASTCHAGWIVLPALLLGLLAWGSEAVGFAWLLHWLGIELSLRYAVFVYAASMLAGAVSVMPGGLGGAEAAMIGLLTLAGARADSAVAATILIRLTTLWFAVGLGMLVLGGLRRSGAVESALTAKLVGGNE